MINQGDVIKHKAALDVAIQVMYASTNPMTNDVEISGIWLNQGQVQSYSMNIPVEFIIKEKHVSNWLRCEKPSSKFIRNETWSELK
jgi:hypothetical protein